MNHSVVSFRLSVFPISSTNWSIQLLKSLSSLFVPVTVQQHELGQLNRPNERWSPFRRFPRWKFIYPRVEIRRKHFEYDQTSIECLGSIDAIFSRQSSSSVSLLSNETPLNRSRHPLDVYDWQRLFILSLDELPSKMSKWQQINCCRWQQTFER